MGYSQRWVLTPIDLLLAGWSPLSGQTPCGNCILPIVWLWSSQEAENYTKTLSHGLVSLSRWIMKHVW